jgi:SAM-dependent methyltransferase
MALRDLLGLPWRLNDAPERADLAQSRPEAAGQWQRRVGWHDAVLSGWYQDETGEVYRGFTVRPDDVVLDVGCGDGVIANFCARRGAHVIFADIDAAKVAAVARRLAVTPARALTPLVTNTAPLPLADAIATKIVATEVIEHVDDPAQFLSELARVGRPGASYLLTVPDPIAENLQKQLAPPIYFAKPNHIRIIGREEFGKLVEAAGLVIERRSAYGFYWTLWWAMFWICNVDLGSPDHPILSRWADTWSAVLDNERGYEVKRVLDAFMPKSQIILARKPATATDGARHRNETARDRVVSSSKTASDDWVSHNFEERLKKAVPPEDEFDVGDFMKVLQGEVVAGGPLGLGVAVHRRNRAAKFRRALARTVARKQRPRLKELLRLDNAEFIQTAYRVLFGRNADPEGEATFLTLLRSGTDRLEILHTLVTSPEGRSCHAKMPGLLRRMWLRNLRVRMFGNASRAAK